MQICCAIIHFATFHSLCKVLLRLFWQHKCFRIYGNKYTVKTSSNKPNWTKTYTYGIVILDKRRLPACLLNEIWLFLETNHFGWNFNRWIGVDGVRRECYHDMYILQRGSGQSTKEGGPSWCNVIKHQSGVALVLSQRISLFHGLTLNNG